MAGWPCYLDNLEGLLSHCKNSPSALEPDWRQLLVSGWQRTILRYFGFCCLCFYVLLEHSLHTRRERVIKNRF